MKIKVLDPKTVAKIAAGEVIHRPANIVKELVENAVDAGADFIRVEIQNGGIDLIEVSDNGSGIPEDEMETAVLAHATSKLTKLEDLDYLETMGFRGEALASICLVTDFTLMSKTEDAPVGISLKYHDGKLVEKSQVAMNKGTTVRCENLFDTIPVRRKFLKSSSAESMAVGDILQKLAVAHTDVGMVYVKDGKEIFRTGTQDDLKRTIRRLFGDAYADNIKELDFQNETIKVHAYLSNALYYRGNRGLQYIFVNDRFVKDEEIAKRVERQYKGLIPNGRFPAFVLFFDVDSDKIDINIHPGKERIKWSFDESVFDDFEKGVHDALFETHEVRTFERPEIRGSIPLSEYRRAVKDGSVEELKARLDALTPPRTVREPASTYQVTREKPAPIRFDFSSVTEPGTLDFRPETAPRSDEEKKRIFFESIRIIGVLFHTYILGELPDEDEIVLIDQHAAHERILYETYSREFQEAAVEKQMLLAPMVLELRADEVELCEKHRETLERLGYEFRPFGGKAIALTAVPIVLGYPRGEEMIREVIDAMAEIGDSDPGSVDARIIMMSCKKAVKGGNILSAPENQKLMELLAKAENPYTCPHGRPTLIKLTRDELERMFMRQK